MLLPFGRVCKIILARRVSSAYTSCWQFCVQPCTKHSAKRKKNKKKRLILVWGFLRVFVGFCLHLATPLRLLGFFCSKSISEQRGWCVVFTVLYNWFVQFSAPGRLFSQCLSSGLTGFSQSLERRWNVPTNPVRDLCSVFTERETVLGSPGSNFAGFVFWARLRGTFLN